MRSPLKKLSKITLTLVDNSPTYEAEFGPESISDGPQLEISQDKVPSTKMKGTSTTFNDE